MNFEYIFARTSRDSAWLGWRLKPEHVSCVAYCHDVARLLRVNLELLSENGLELESRKRSPSCSTQERLYARQQFSNIEWLGEIIIRAGIEAAHFIGRLDASGEHENSRVDPALSQLAAHRETIRTRQQDVQKNQVESASSHSFERSAAFSGTLYGIALRGERIAQRERQVRIIFDD